MKLPASERIGCTTLNLRLEDLNKQLRSPDLRRGSRGRRGWIKEVQSGTT